MHPRTPLGVPAVATFVGPSIKSVEGLNAEQALATLRDILAKPKGVVRNVVSLKSPRTSAKTPTEA